MSTELDALQALASNYETTTVTLSPESLAVLFYGLEEKKNPAVWLTKEPGDEISDTDRDAIEEIADRAFRELMTGAIMTFPTNAISFPPQWVGNTGYEAQYGPAGDLNAIFNVAGVALPFEIGAGFHTEVLLEAGVYNFTVHGVSTPNAGILGWFVDGESFITDQDWYFSSSLFDVKTGTLLIGTPGRHVISCHVTGKNAESTDYQFGLIFFSLVKTE